MKNVSRNVTLLVITGSFGLFGCEGEPSSEAPQQAEAPAGEHHDEHDHPSEGPHHGALIELGQDEYHAELVHDEDAGTVTIYLLDSAVKKAVAIDADEVTVNVTHDGMPEQFRLSAEPLDTDPDGQSSRFVSNEVELTERLHEEAVSARLVVSISGKSYNGRVPAEHDHGHEN